MKQKIILVNEDYSKLDFLLTEYGTKSIFLVCDNAIKFLRINEYFSELEDRLEIKTVIFSDFASNPLYESVKSGVEIFCEKECDTIVAVGGGSAIDVAKCIKLFSNMNKSESFLTQKIVPNNIPFIVAPTTAGTGSEATKYAVIYFNGEKQSITDDSCIPENVIFDPSFLVSLPLYQKKSTLLDAFCHSIESLWSLNSTNESKQYAKDALNLIIKNKDEYISGNANTCESMLKAAYLAGKAINISQTTAGHAMSYKLTSLYGIAHGHAVALCLYTLIPYMVDNLDKCIDPRGEKYFADTIKEIFEIFGSENISEGVNQILDFIDSIGIETPNNASESDINILKNSVNPVRMRNNPIKIPNSDIELLYRKLLGMGV